MVIKTMTPLESAVAKPVVTSSDIDASARVPDGGALMVRVGVDV